MTVLHRFYGSMQHGLKTELFSVDHAVYYHKSVWEGGREREREKTREWEDKREIETGIKSFQHWRLLSALAWLNEWKAHQHYCNHCNTTNICFRADPQKTLIICNSDSEWVTVALHSTFLNLRQSGYTTALSICYIAGAVWNCCHPSACFVYTIQPCTRLQCHFIWSLIRTKGACVFSWTLNPALLAEWPGSFRCCCSNMEQIPE